MQFLLSQSPYRDLVVPWKIFHAHDVDAVDLLPTIVQFFVFKPVLLAALSCKHLVSFHVAYRLFSPFCFYFNGNPRLRNPTVMIQTMEYIDFKKTGETLSETKANNIALALSRSTFYETYRALFWADFDLTLFDTKDTDQLVVYNSFISNIFVSSSSYPLRKVFTFFFFFFVYSQCA